MTTVNLPIAPPETKVAAGGIVGLAISAVLQLRAVYAPHITPPRVVLW